MPQHVLSFLFAFSIVFASVPSQAQANNEMSTSLAGLIEMRGEQPFIQLRGRSDSLPLYGMTQALVSDLHRLRHGDFLIGHGRFLTDRRIIVLDAIDTVGLRQILGSWRTKNWKIFEFKDFNRLNLYIRTQNNRSTPIFNSERQLNYTLAPDTGATSWSIFMADSTGVHIGSLEIGVRHMTLRIYNSDTGGVSEQLELAPISR